MNDATFDALANEHRRTLLVALLEENPLDATASIPVDEDPGIPKPEQQLQIEMYHRHLPKLADEGFIRWNRDTTHVVEGPQFEELRPLLDVVASHAER